MKAIDAREIADSKEPDERLLKSWWVRLHLAMVYQEIKERAEEERFSADVTNIIWLLKAKTLRVVIRELDRKGYHVRYHTSYNGKPTCIIEWREPKGA